VAEIFKYDLENFGLWGNGLGYIITFTILIFMVYNKPVWITPNQSGSILGLQIVIIFLFFVCLIILRLRVISFEQK